MHHVPKGNTIPKNHVVFPVLLAFYSLSINAKLLYSHKAYRSEVSPVAETNLHFHVSPSDWQRHVAEKTPPGRGSGDVRNGLGNTVEFQKNYEFKCHMFPCFLFQRSFKGYETSGRNKRPIVWLPIWNEDRIRCVPCCWVLPQQK